jgi:hypothetical protein
MLDKIYPDLSPEDLGRHYMMHIDRMTVEELYSKSDIAAQLAWRDKQIEELRAEIDELLSYNRKIVDWTLEGESIMKDAGPMFKLGVWWANRPWGKL